MKKIIVAALAAAVATLSFTADADARNRGFQWHNHGWHHSYNRGWHGRNYAWRHNGWRHHNHGWYGGYWGPGWGYWGGPTIVIGGPGYYDDYCYVRKVRRHDYNGHVYVRRVRVCR